MPALFDVGVCLHRQRTSYRILAEPDQGLCNERQNYAFPLLLQHNAQLRKEPVHSHVFI